VIEQHFLDFIKSSSDRITVIRPVETLCLEIDSSQVNDPDAYPVKLSLQEPVPAQINGYSRNQTRRQDIRCKYLVGCDGAHSWTRRLLNIPMEGSLTESVWGVMDIIPITDFREASILA
jgi:hypothetical protein